MEKRTQLETLMLHLREYLSENFKLLVLTTYEKISRLVAGITSVLFISFLAALIMLFLSVGLSVWIGKMMHETYAGFFIVGGGYLLLGIIFFVMRDKWIHRPVIDVLLKNMTDENN
jgi:hypothetical protein